MKKYTFILVLTALFLSIPAFAQQHTETNVGIAQRLWRSLRRAINQNNVEWVDRIQAEDRAVHPSGPLGEMLFVKTHNFEQQPVQKDIELLYNQRIAFLQEKIKKNHTLSTYTLTVPRPEDLTNLTEEDLLYLEKFLVQPADKDEANLEYMPRVSKIQKGVVELSFSDHVSGPIFLRVDVTKKKIYLFYSSHPHK